MSNLLRVVALLYLVSSSTGDRQTAFDDLGKALFPPIFFVPYEILFFPAIFAGLEVALLFNFAIARFLRESFFNFGRIEEDILLNEEIYGIHFNVNTTNYTNIFLLSLSNGDILLQQTRGINHKHSTTQIKPIGTSD